MTNYDSVLCAKCGKIIWKDAVPAMGADGDKVDDVFYHEKCANEMPEMSDDEKDYEAMKLDEYQMDNLVK